MCPLAASAGSRCFSRLAWYPRAARSRRAATASARTSRNRRVCVRASRLEPDDLPGRIAPDRGCRLLACLSPTHLFRSPADRLTRSPPPRTLQISWLSPPKGSVSGGTVMTVYGSGFKRSPVAKVRPRSPSRVQIERARARNTRPIDHRTNPTHADSARNSNAKRLPNAFVAKTQCRFATENEFDEVELVYVSDSEGRCVTPRRRTPSTAQVTVSNDGRQFSGWPLVYTKGSGTFLKFLFDNSQPGCFDCVNSEFPRLRGWLGFEPGADHGAVDHRQQDRPVRRRHGGDGHGERAGLGKGGRRASVRLVRPGVWVAVQRPGGADRARRTRTTSTLRVTGTVRPSQARSTRI